MLPNKEKHRYNRKTFSYKLEKKIVRRLRSMGPLVEKNEIVLPLNNVAAKLVNKGILKPRLTRARAKPHKSEVFSNIASRDQLNSSETFAYVNGHIAAETSTALTTDAAEVLLSPAILENDHNLESRDSNKKQHVTTKPNDTKKVYNYPTVFESTEVVVELNAYITENLRNSLPSYAVPVNFGDFLNDNNTQEQQLSINLDICQTTTNATVNSWSEKKKNSNEAVMKWLETIPDGHCTVVEIDENENVSASVNEANNLNLTHVESSEAAAASGATADELCLSNNELADSNVNLKGFTLQSQDYVFAHSINEGQIFWGQIYAFCYWPCIVCLDAATKSLLKKRNEVTQLHVRFFADSGRRGWVDIERMLPFRGLDHYNQCIDAATADIHKTIPDGRRKMGWHIAINEANEVNDYALTQRMAKFFEVLQRTKQVKKEARKSFKSLDRSSEGIEKRRKLIKAEPILNHGTRKSLRCIENLNNKMHKRSNSLAAESLLPEVKRLKTANPTTSTDVASSANNGINEDMAANGKSPVKRQKSRRNRPIEEVIDDILSLDAKHLFDGKTRDNVCKYCLSAIGRIEQCSKGCFTWLHVDCLSSKTDTDNVSETQVSVSAVNKKQRRKSHKAAVNGASLQKYPITADDITADDQSAALSLRIICQECANDENPKCFVCQHHISDKNKDEKPIACSYSKCHNFYHPNCLRDWPQTRIVRSKNMVQSLRCPMHVCHTCVCSNPQDLYHQASENDLVKCIKCPATYHTDSACIPAGSEILTAANIICPRHDNPKPNDTNVNVNWCFICTEGSHNNALILCESCPTAVHQKCLNRTIEENEIYVCDECLSGRLPLYGDLVWSKFSNSRWWPAVILPPCQVPINIRTLAHEKFDFVVRFLGTHNHGWLSRHRVYQYVKEDYDKEMAQSRNKKLPKTHAYIRALEDINRCYQKMQLWREAEHLKGHKKIVVKPEPYKSIKTNQYLIPVKPNFDAVNKCNCSASDENPCGVDSPCINRTMFYECPKDCPAGERCENQMFERRISPKLQPVYVDDRGFGLFCLEDIKRDSFVIEYVGEVIDSKEFQQRMQEKCINHDENYYFFELSKDHILDAESKGNLARFINHSCDPNCETRKWQVNGIVRVGLFALDDIKANTELTFNYHLDGLSKRAKKICLCGTAKCVGFIGNQKIKEKPHTINPSAKKAIRTKKRKRRANANKPVATANAAAATTRQLNNGPSSLAAV